MNWEAIGVTDRGRKRRRNEDAFLLEAEAGIFAVADGMGGHAGGDVASRTAIQAFHGAVGAALADGTAGDRMEDALSGAVAIANAAIFERAALEPALAGMGTTLTALGIVAADAGCVIAHVGDSRAYRLRRAGVERRGPAFEQITTDHTWVQEQVEAGLLSPAQARTDPRASILTRALGTHEDVAVDVIRTDLRAGDLFLLCSDGLTGMIDDPDLEAILRRDLPLDECARELVEAANLRGGLDNITAILIRVAE